MHFIFNLHLPSTTLYEHIFSSQSCLILMLLMCMWKWRSSFISDFCTVCRNMQSRPQFKKRALTLTLLCVHVSTSESTHYLQCASCHIPIPVCILTQRCVMEKAQRKNKTKWTHTTGWKQHSSYAKVERVYVWEEEKTLYEYIYCKCFGRT